MNDYQKFLKNQMKNKAGANGQSGFRGGASGGAGGRNATGTPFNYQAGDGKLVSLSVGRF